MSIIGSCNSCLLEVDSKDKSVNCPECNRIYHENCWEKNDNKCSEYGCKGKKEIVEIDNSQDSSQNQTENLNNSEPNTDSVISENNNFRKVNRSPQDKFIVGLLLTIVILLGFIAVNFFKKNDVQVVQNPISSSSPSNIEEKVYYSPTPESKETSEYVPTPQETTNNPVIENTPTPDPTPTISDENRDSQIKYLITKSRKIKNEGFLKLDSSEFETVFTDKALKDYKGGVNWCKENNAYRETVTRELNIESISLIDNKIEVIANVNEKSNYYQNGDYKKKDSYDKSYRVKYTVLQEYNNEFKISDAQVIK